MQHSASLQAARSGARSYAPPRVSASATERGDDITAINLELGGSEHRSLLDGLGEVGLVSRAESCGQIGFGVRCDRNVSFSQANRAA
jgi:hypothetical protein